jgi:Ca-activated chloride channel family protein
VDLLWPYGLWLLPVVPLLIGVYVWALRRRKPMGARYSSLSLVRDAVPRSSRVRRHLPFALFVLSLASLIVALARPAAIVSVPAGRTTIILAIDVSGSMCSTDIEPTRLEAAEAAAASFIQTQGSRTQIGIVAFAGFAEMVQPPTTDQNALLDALRSLQTGRATAIGSGILRSIDAISEIDGTVAPSVDAESGDPAPPPVAKGAFAPDIIVVLTDGVSNAGPAPVDAAQQAADRGVRVYPIGFGTANAGGLEPRCRAQFIGREPVGGQQFGGGGFFGNGNQGGFRRGIDEETLKQVAALTDGQYYPAESAGDLQKVFEGLPMNLIMKHDVVEISVAFVAAGVILAGGAILLSRLWRPLP